MVQPVNRAQDLVDEEFPEVYRPLVPGALRRAYASADQAFDRLEFLGTPSGRFQRGDLIVLAAEFEFLKLIKEGHLPFEPSWDDYAAPTGKHLVMRSPGALITINQVDYATQKPRWAKFRDQLAVPTAEYLFAEMNDAVRKDRTRKHVLLLHGHGKLRFSNLAVPHPGANSLVWRTNDLLKLSPEPASAATRDGGEGPTESPQAELVEELIKTVRDA